MPTNDVRLNTKTLDSILRSDNDARLANDLTTRAARIAARAGAHYTFDTWRGRRRFRANVHSIQPVIVARSPLLSAVDAGRGS